MRTRNSYFPNNSSATIPRRRNKKRTPNVVEPELRIIVEMADNRTMEELLQAPTKGYGEAIVIPEINADHFEIKTNLLQLVQANPYHGFERENPHTHINNFKRITSTLKFMDVPNDVIKLMMFPYSFEGNARVWYDKEPPNSILTWEDLVNNFVNQFFHPSKTTHLKNEISRFTQRFKETFGEACERFKEMLRACPHHGFTKLAQIDTFYNGLNDNDQDSLNAVAGGNLLSKTTREALENANKSDDRIDKLAEQVLTLVDIFAKKVVAPAPVKAVEESCNQSSTSGTLPSNTIANPKGEMKAITTRSGVVYEGPLIPTPKKTLPKPNKPYPLRLTDQKLHEKATNQMEKFFQIFQDLHFDISFTDALLLMPKFASMIKSLLTNKDKLFDLAKISLNENCSAMLLKNLLKKLGDPSKILIPWKSFLRTDSALIDVYGEEITLRVNDEAVTFNLNQATRYSSTYDDLSGSDFILEEIDAYLKDESVSPKIDHADCESKGDICLIKKLLNDNPFQLPPMDLKQREPVKAKSLIKEPPELELKELPSHLEYTYLEGVDKLPVIISKDLKVDEKEALLKVLKSHKKAIAWKITDIKGIDPRFCTHKILMEEDYKPTMQSQRRVNLKIHEVIKKEVIKLLDAEMIYPISDSSWGSPIHCVPEKGGIIIVENENNELIPTRMPFGLCNAPGTFQRCMMVIFHDMIEKTVEVFMDDFLEKCHFMVKERIVLGHKISKNGLEVDRSKVDAIAKLPYPTTVKGVRSFLGHASFYRRFIQDFYKIARPMTHLLEKKTPFVFSKDCIDAFETLKKKLTEASILVVPH
nr:DNA-directed DNA polymerase [Tanacetum cinerariifolium]